MNILPQVKRMGRAPGTLFLWIATHRAISVVGLFLLFTVAVGALHTLPVLAQSDNPLEDVEDAQGIVDRVLCPIAAAMFWILLAVSVIMVLVGAFMYLTAGGDAEKVKKAHLTLTYAATGVVVAFLASTFPAIIASIFSRGFFSGSRFLQCTFLGGF